jgi:WD40 repeat protein
VSQIIEKLIQPSSLFLLIGIILIVIALIGPIEIQNNKIGIALDNGRDRLVSGIIGIFFLIISFLPHLSKSSVSSVPAATSSPTLNENSGLFSPYATLYETLLSPANADEINSVRTSSDGKVLIAGGDEDIVRVWSIRDRKHIGNLIDSQIPGGLSHRGNILSVATSSDGKTIVSGGKDKTVKIWNRTDKGYDGTVKIWELTRGQLLADINDEKGNANILSLSLSANGKILAFGDSKGYIHLWDLSNPRNPKRKIEKIRAHSRSIWGLDIYADRLLVSGSDDMIITIWDLTTGASLKSLVELDNNQNLCSDNSHEINAVAFSPDGKLVASGSDDGTISLWDVETGKLKSKSKRYLGEYQENGQEGHTREVWSVTFTPDGTKLISSSADSQIKFWKIPS